MKKELSFWYFLVCGVFALFYHIVYHTKYLMTAPGIWLGFGGGLSLFLLFVFYQDYIKPARAGVKKEDFVRAKISLAIFILLTFGTAPLLYFAVNYERVTCQSPNTVIGYRCCVPSVDGMMCQDEFEVASQKLDRSIALYIVTDGSSLSHQNPPFSFRSPRDYYLVQDIQIGGIEVPYYLIAYGQTEYDVIEIMVSHFETQRDAPQFESSTSTSFSAREFLRGILSASQDISEFEILKDEEMTTAKGLHAYVIESMGRYPGYLSKVYAKAVLLENIAQNYAVVLKFASTEDYMGYVEEFDEMVDSFKFSPY